MFRDLLSIILIGIALSTSGCTLSDFRPREIVEGKHITDFTLDGKVIYFGAGYNLYRVDPLTRSVETVFQTDRIFVEQPLVSDGVAYFGGTGKVDSKGTAGERYNFIALDLRSGQVLWKFPLGHDGYGTFGTYPVIAGDRILVCARQHLHCLDRRTGKELWKVDNWLGSDSDGITIPYVHDGLVYYKIYEEDFAKSDANDGHWAVVSLESGQRIGLIRVADRPGKYEDTRGNGVGVLSDGIVYGATRYSSYPTSRVGALDLKGSKLLWEVPGSPASRMRPAVNDKYVFTTVGDSVQALERADGKVRWSYSLGEIAEFGIDRSTDRVKWDFENHDSRRFAATNEVVVTRGSQGVAARVADTGKLIWIAKMPSYSGYGAPLIVDQIVLVSSAKDCSVLALDLKTGNELWRASVPDCSSYTVADNS